MKHYTILLLNCLFSLALFAQAPQAFNYQGIVRDAAGIPIPNQNVSLQIAILQGTSSGPELYKETHAATTNDFGLFTVMVGNGTVVNGMFSNIDWGSDDHFLQLEVDITGGSSFQLIGSTQLVSVPYALYAESAANGSKWEDNSAGIHYDMGSVGINTNAPDFNLDVNGSMRLNSISNPGRDYTIICASRQEIFANNDLVTYVDGTKEFRVGVDIPNSTLNITDGGGTKFFVANGTTQNVGLSTLSPASKLHVNDGDIYIEDSNNGVIMKSPDGNCWRMTVANSGNPVFTSITCPN